MSLRRIEGQAVSAARRATEELKTDQLDSASRSIASARKDGIALALEAERLVRRMVAVEDHYIAKEKEISRIAGELKNDELRMRERKMVIEKELSQRKSEETRQNQLLREAESDLARSRRQEEEEKAEKDKMIAASIVTGVVGLGLSILTFGAAAPLAVGATAACAVSAVNHADNQKRAEKAADNARDGIRTARQNIQDCNNRISQIERDISTLGPKIREREREAGKYHEMRGEFRDLIVFVKEAQGYWNEYAEATKSSIDRASSIQKITEKAREKRFLGYFSRRHGKRQAMDFLEAWEEVYKIGQTGSKHLFEMEFECSYCKDQFRSLPYVQNGNLICNSCNHEYN